VFEENPKIYVVGYSGHSYVVLNSMFENGLKPIGYLNPIKVENNPYNLEYLGYEGDGSFKGWNENSSFVITIGDNAIRTKIAEKIRSRGKNCLSIIDKRSYVARNATIEDGTFVAPGAIINVFCRIGRDVIVNSGAIVEHESVVSSGTHIAPGAVILGNVKIGEHTFIGANSVIKQGVHIGDNVIIGAGSVVINDVEDNNVVVGNPAKKHL